jgi:hypothetical protein
VRSQQERKQAGFSVERWLVTRPARIGPSAFLKWTAPNGSEQPTVPVVFFFFFHEDMNINAE